MPDNAPNYANARTEAIELLHRVNWICTIPDRIVSDYELHMLARQSLERLASDMGFTVVEREQ